MVTFLFKCLSSCRRPQVSKINSVEDSDEIVRQDGLLWYKDSGQHANGELSMAVFQGNKIIEDHCQVESGSLSLSESGPFGSFVGVYDGHGGPEAARYISNHLFGHFKKFANEQQSMSLNVLRKAIQATEKGFLSLVSQIWTLKPQIASVGSCCLVGVVCDGIIYIASLGDSRAVLGRLERRTGKVMAIQLSNEHNVSIESVRNEVQSSHPDDSQIVVLRHNVWRVKGLIQVSRSIGDAYLKKPEFNCELLDAKFRLRETFIKPILSSEPSVSVQKVQPEDQFIIFATDGLWEQISNQEAVNIVMNKPRNGIARRLVRAAILQAAKKREMRYSDIMKIDLDVRRHFHDDISVIVLFLDSNLVSEVSSSHSRSVSLRVGSTPHLPASNKEKQ